VHEEAGGEGLQGQSGGDDVRLLLPLPSLVIATTRPFPLHTVPSRPAGEIAVLVSLRYC
jgi:hypothetical protein